MLLESFEIPLLNLPPISAKSLRIPVMTSSSSDGSGSDGSPCFGEGGSGGGARNEATPQNWRERVLVISERSPLTPPRGSEDGEAGSSAEGLGLGFWSVAVVEWSSSSSSSLRELAMDLASHDIVDVIGELGSFGGKASVCGFFSDFKVWVSDLESL